MAIAGFAVAVAVYALAFVAYVGFVQAPFGQHLEGPQLDSRADGGLVEMLAAPGGLDRQLLSGTAADEPWYKNPDKIKRFGLTYADRPGILDPDKLRNLTKGTFERNATNNLLDYEEARLALGIGDYDFHLRTYPMLSSLDEGGTVPVKGLKVAYLADYSKDQAGGPYNKPVLTTAPVVEQDANALWVNLTLINNGTNSAVFQVQAEVEELDRGSLVDTMDTFYLEGNGTLGGWQPGTWHNLTLKLYKTTSWQWDDPLDAQATFTISDPTSPTIAEIEVSLASYVMNTGNANDRSFISVAPDKLSYTTTGNAPEFTFRMYDGEGRQEGGNSDKVILEVRKPAPDHTLVWTWEGWESNNRKQMTAGLLTAGKYNISATAKNHAWLAANDTFEVRNDPAGSFTSSVQGPLTESAASKYERGLLAGLVEGWRNTTYEVGSGDVYPDQKQVLNNDLAANLTSDKYQILVVGSEVDHNSMTSESAKGSVRDWVQRGGLLIVLGSLNQQVSWLQPLFHATLTTSGDSIGVPDNTHPILHVPQELAWQTYADNGKTWKFNSDEDASHFTHVITRESGERWEDVLAVSKPGHFGNGTIILTAWAIFQLASPQPDGEARSTLYNFMMHALGYLYIDFGPRIPDHAEVGSAARMATAPHPVFKAERVLVRTMLYVFR